MAFFVGQKVTLTPYGAQESRKYKKMKRRVISAGVGAVALPAIIPGAGIGIAGAMGGIGVGEPLQAAIGGAMGFMAGDAKEEPEAGLPGIVREVRSRISGRDVLVEWTLFTKEKGTFYKQCWHRPNHLVAR